MRVFLLVLQYADDRSMYITLLAHCPAGMAQKDSDLQNSSFLSLIENLPVAFQILNLRCLMGMEKNVCVKKA